MGSKLIEFDDLVFVRVDLLNSITILFIEFGWVSWRSVSGSVHSRARFCYGARFAFKVQRFVIELGFSFSYRARFTSELGFSLTLFLPSSVCYRTRFLLFVQRRGIWYLYSFPGSSLYLFLAVERGPWEWDWGQAIGKVKKCYTRGFFLA